MSLATSVIMSVNNKERYIGRLLAHLRQSTDIDELVLIDDGSTDETGNVLKKFADKFVRTEDIWEVKANNVGLRISRGDYVCIIQDDDFIIGTNWLSKVVRFMEDNNIAIFSGRGVGHSYFSTGKDASVAAIEEKIESMTGEYLSATNEVFGENDRHVLYRTTYEVINKPPFFPVFTCDATIRSPLVLSRKILDAFEAFDETFAPLTYDDHDLCLKSTLNNFCVAFCRIPMLSRYEGGSSGLYISPTMDGPVLARATYKNKKHIFQRYAQALLDRTPTCNFLGILKF